MAIIPLNGRGSGKCVLIDDDMFEALACYQWHLSTKGYAQTSVRLPNGKYRTVRMHQVVMHTLGTKKIADHINGDKLDNRRVNLRLCTITQNAQNSHKPANNTSGFKGVAWHIHHKKWTAYITANRKRQYLGEFLDKTEAAEAYNKAAIAFHGEYARLNSI